MESKIYFLNFTVFWKNNNFDFDIYRKPTETDHTILGWSNHRIGHKMTDIHCYLNKKLNISISVNNFKRTLIVLHKLPSITAIILNVFMNY